MYIALETIKAWEIKGDFIAKVFFSSLSIILSDQDYLVIGAYNPSPSSIDIMTRYEITNNNEAYPFNHSFDFNRDEYPIGRAYVFKFENHLVEELVNLATQENGSNDKQLFFDHVLAYRPGTPTIPLLNFHDAFYGGSLYLSGLFCKKKVTDFANSLNAHAKDDFNLAIKGMLARES